MEWRVFKPPLQPPTVNANFTFPFRTNTSYAVSAGSATTTARIEDAIISVCETVAMTSSWYPLIGVRIMAVSVYSILADIAEPVIGHTHIVFDPTIAMNSQVKSIADKGDINDPARTGITYPVAVNQHVFTWDGTAGTSPKVAGIRWQKKCEGVIYWDLVVSVDHAYAAALQEHLVVATRRPPNFLMLDGPELK